MSFRIRCYRENHGEALFLTIVSVLQIFVWLVWISGTLTSTPHYRDGFVAFGLVGNATLVFMIMFLPKGRQLAAIGGRDVISSNAIDQMDHLSIVSSPSVYASTFLQAKSDNIGASNKSSLLNYRRSFGGDVSNDNNSAMNPNTNFSYQQQYYQKFSGTTIHSRRPNDGTNSTTITQPIMNSQQSHKSLNRPISNSYSSHAIFSVQNHDRSRSQDHSGHHNDGNNENNNLNDDDDPNYSNLSNVFTTSSTVGVTLSSNDGSKTSPLSENVSSHSSNSGSTSNPKSFSRVPSLSKSTKHFNATQIKSPNEPIFEMTLFASLKA
ncbi:7 transmembrane sweet-taste receptor-like protein 2 [Sarcoptes scabiei]|uniref:7 transmembrane sweet-taste receptor-like protein 2 n=1 Tax=Sarcoptes scabiei TaxID=52283 RepID=A0A132A7P4_SARSC|nr:7 transmembrane sweet-taste receptor-like protein 2 [Sarcoptes scabiei]